ncbi:MAG: hypothetical protein QG670_2496 [Thermoproteota archaeon]|nr:hypothetical protein [Thermoproteota archaeon]
MTNTVKYEIQHSFWERIFGRKKKDEKNIIVGRGHKSLKGAAIGIALGLVLYLLNANFWFFLLVPFTAGVVAEKAGSGAKAGILTLLITVILIIPLANLTPPNVGGMPSFNESEGVGVGAVFAALGNSIGSSASVIMGGFGALFQALGTIIFFIILIVLVVMFAVGLFVTAILGAVGGAAGGVVVGILRRK